MDKIINCKKCNREIETNAKICPHCGAKITGNKGCLIGVIIAVVVVVIIFIAASGGSKSTSTDSGKPQETSKTNERSIFDIYSLLETNDEIPFTMTALAKETLKTKPQLFENATEEIALNNADSAITYNHLSKNIEKYGDKLISIPEAYVVNISETDMGNGKTCTEFQVLDADENSYYVFYVGELDNVFKDDIVKIYALPLALTSFDNVSGGTTIATVLAGSYIQKIEE